MLTPPSWPGHCCGKLPTPLGWGSAGMGQRRDGTVLVPQMCYPFPVLLGWPGMNASLSIACGKRAGVDQEGAAQAQVLVGEL